MATLSENARRCHLGGWAHLRDFVQGLCIRSIGSRHPPSPIPFSPNTPIPASVATTETTIAFQALSCGHPSVICSTSPRSRYSLLASSSSQSRCSLGATSTVISGSKGWIGYAPWHIFDLINMQRLSRLLSSPTTHIFCI